MGNATLFAVCLFGFLFQDRAEKIVATMTGPIVIVPRAERSTTVSVSFEPHVRVNGIDWKIILVPISDSKEHRAKRFDDMQKISRSQGKSIRLSGELFVVKPQGLHDGFQFLIEARSFKIRDE